MKFPFKKNITVLLLASLLTVGLFSFTMALHGSNGEMEGDCIFSTMGANLCPQDALTKLAHHLSAYHEFFNVPVTPFVIVLMFLVLELVIRLLVFVFSPPLLEPSYIQIHRRNTPRSSYKKKITHWLSLFENSPAFV
ncbi:MAG: hypothetical protein AAB458_02915 [Patescibacteria group bacterium]